MQLSGYNPMVLGGQDLTVGNSSASFRMDAAGTWSVEIPFPSGTNTIQVDVKQSVNVSPRPTLIVKANPDFGVNADVTGTAGSGAGFVTIGPLTVAPTSDAALTVILANNYDSQDGGAPCYWTNLIVLP